MLDSWTQRANRCVFIHSSIYLFVSLCCCFSLFLIDFITTSMVMYTQENMFEIISIHYSTSVCNYIVLPPPTCFASSSPLRMHAITNRIMNLNCNLISHYGFLWNQYSMKCNSGNSLTALNLMEIKCQCWFKMPFSMDLNAK